MFFSIHSHTYNHLRKPRILVRSSFKNLPKDFARLFSPFFPSRSTSPIIILWSRVCVFEDVQSILSKVKK
jgi:hypothetical protein